jgi:CubicO group peptidase (beta-lactamase class C family)
MSGIRGRVAPGFEPVREAFAQNFAERREVGAALCVLRDGVPVVDLWGGVADAASGRAWEEDTLAVVLSTTKGVTATCIHHLLERGVLDLDAPVASYWPEFAAAGKGEIPLRDVLTHCAGVPSVDAELTLEEVCAWDPVCEAIAAQAPEWEPGTRHGYHVRTFGWILGEVVRRATGATLGSYFAKEIAAPLGLDFYIGLPLEHEPRVAAMLAPLEPSDPEEIALRERFMGPETLLGRALTGPSNLFRHGPMWNRRALHATEMPSSNGIGSARAVARLYAALVGEIDGRRLLDPTTVERARALRVEGPDAVIRVPTRFGLGFMLPPSLGPTCPDGCFGHPGAGGSLGFADPDARLGFGYVMNQMQLGLTGDARAASLVESVYDSLRESRP